MVFGTVVRVSREVTVGDLICWISATHKGTWTELLVSGHFKKKAKRMQQELPRTQAWQAQEPGTEWGSWLFTCGVILAPSSFLPQFPHL